MGEMLAYPFRVSPSGHLVTVDETSDAAINQLIAAAIMTQPGERPLFPTFGIDDPTFGEIVGARLAAVLSQFGPNVGLEDVSTSFIDGTTQEVVITYREERSNA